MVVVVCANVNHIKWIQTICGMFYSAFALHDWTDFWTMSTFNGRDLILDVTFGRTVSSPPKIPCYIFMRIHDDDVCSTGEYHGQATSTQLKRAIPMSRT